MLGDIHQLIGFCNEIESNAFIPFKEEDLGADVAIRMDRYNMVVDSVTNLMLKQKTFPASKKGLHATAQYNGFTQYIKTADFSLGIYYERSLWKKQSSLCTPYWLYIASKDWKQDDAIKRYFSLLPVRMTERNPNGSIFIALETPTGRTLEETAQYLCEQILHHITDAKAVCDEWQRTHPN